MTARTMRPSGKPIMRYLLIGMGVSVAGLVACLLVVNFRFSRIFSQAHFTHEARGTAEVLYVKGVARGLTGDHQLWWITAHGDREEPDSLTDYVFRGIEPFFYEVNADTMIVYARRAAQTPPAFESGMTVKQIELSNPRMMDFYDRMDSLGLGLAR